ncbi:MAG: hypothetical protein GC185_09635 [Alphaproteobacteria bacterium]|nr:hypothetical protein [Alphaproteobacteria bacterium]
MARQDEREVIGLWFSQIADLVNSCPSRVATAPSRRIEYDRATVSQLSGAFNSMAKSRDQFSPMQRVVAAKHVYRLSPHTDWKPEDEHELEAAAQFAVKTARPEPYEKKGDDMHARLKFLIKVCDTHRIGVTVHTPEPGVITINLVKQDRPSFDHKPKPPAWVHDRQNRPRWKF